MKLNKFILSLSVTFVACIGCSDWLDIRPETEIVLDEFWQDEAQVESVVNSCYRAFIEGDCVERMIVWGELRSDELIKGGNVSTTQLDILAANILPSNSYSEWKAFYSLINYCNTVIYYAPGVRERDPNFSKGQLQFYLSEALTLRALSYFYLVRAFRDVPFVLEPSIDDTQVYKVAKSSGSEILAHIVTDLQLAKSYARDDYPTRQETKGHVTKNAIRALLADIYLWQNNYSACISECNEVLSRVVENDYIITNKTGRDYLRLINGEDYFYDIFTKGNSDESIFELQFSENGVKNDRLKTLYKNTSSSGTGSEQFRVASTAEDFLYNIYGKTDVRGKDFVNMESAGIYTVFKYVGSTRTESTGGKSTYSYRNNTCNWIIYRLTDIMLMKAEAQVQLGGENNLMSALSIVNDTYMRANYDLNEADSLNYADYSTQGSLEDLVLLERHRELAFEGKRWFDLMRYARRHSVSQMYSLFLERKYQDKLISSKMSTMDALYFPINQSDMEKNELLIQNPYYK